MGFFLPQSRPRVYGMFLKQDGPSSWHISRQQERLASAWALFERLQIPGPPEPLRTVLVRCAATKEHCARQFAAAADQQTAKASRHSDSHDVGTKWQAQHQAWAQKKGLTAEDLHRGYASFMQATGSVLNARQRQALWLRLALL